MLRAWERATWDRTGSVIGGIDLSVFGTCAGSASGRVSEISSGLEAGFKSEARGRRIPPDKLGAFPATLVEAGKSDLALRAVLGALEQEGLIAKRSRQRLDSTHIVGAVARLSALECMRETLALALEELDGKLKEGQRPDFWELLWERYVQSKLNYKSAEEVLQSKRRQVGVDSLHLLEWLEPLGAEIREAKGVAFLREVFAQQYELEQSGKI